MFKLPFTFGVFLATFIFFFNISCKKEGLEDLKEELIVMNPQTITLEQNLIYGQALQITINGDTVSSDLFDWSSADEKVASVNDRGVVWGLWAGETEIVVRAKNGRGEARSKIIVTDRKAYKFRLYLKDKGEESSESLSQPQKFLAQRAIDRRNKHKIPINELDLPISKDYLKQIEDIGGVVVSQSKWLNTVVVHCGDVHLMNRYRQLHFVKEVLPVWSGEQSTSNQSPKNSSTKLGFANTENGNGISQKEYKAAWNHLILNNGSTLHEQGYTGQGMAIAVIDAGYEHLNNNNLFSNSNIVEVKSFIFEKPNPYVLDSHGVNVAGLMAANRSGTYIGTAPHATYWLFSTEDNTSEFPVEEDYMVSAMEYADSVGVDIINISLSYDDFEGFMKGYKFEDMDGKTSLSSRAASVAFEKGIFIASSAGNKNRWVSTPSDAVSVLTVGSVRADSSETWFSSYGFTVDKRMKPEVVTLGAPVNIVESDGTISNNRYGTSFSSPIMTGLIACLWQAYPTLTNKQLYDIVLKSSHLHANPRFPFGYGLPNMKSAMILAQEWKN